MESSAIQLLPSYHLVLPGRSKYVYSITTSEFGRHLDIVGAVGGVTQGECTLTFDDCHVSQFRYAFPLLQRDGLRARFFAIAGWIGKRCDYMTPRQLRELVAAGHEVQSHGLTHVPLTRCAQAELSVELSNSRCELEHKLGVAVDAISVPFGRWDRRVIEACAHAGYRRVYTSAPAAPLRLSGVDVLGRFIVRRTTSVAQLRKVLIGDRRELRRLGARERYRQLVRASVGEPTYFKLWAIVRSSRNTLAAARIYGSQAQ